MLSRVSARTMFIQQIMKKGVRAKIEKTKLVPVEMLVAGLVAKWTNLVRFGVGGIVGGGDAGGGPGGGGDGRG